MAMTPQEAAAKGLGWVPENHPLYGTPGYAGYNGTGEQRATGGGLVPIDPSAANASANPYLPPATMAPNAPTGTPIDQQNQNAQTYSQTPGNVPLNNTTNQGVQDTVRNSYLQSIQKGTNVDVNDPTFRMQSDAYAAAQERARRNAVDDQLEQSFAQGTRGSGADTAAARLINERAATNVGQFEAQLMGRELESRRDEIKNALSSLGGLINADQSMALQRELAALDAALKRESLAQTGALGTSDLSLRDKLGTGALNVDLIRALLQNQQFGSEFGLALGNSEFNNWARMAGL